MFIFNPQSELFRYPQGGINVNEKISINIYVERAIVVIPKITIYKRHDYENILYKEINMDWVGLKGDNDVYGCEFSLEESGQYFYTFNLNNHTTSLYELLICDANYRTPEWIKGGVIYHIFVDRFYKKNTLKKDDDIILRDDWCGMPHFLPDENNEVRNNDFFGGNLEGIKEKLPYLYDLGVSTIYLSPIFEAHSNHKYDTANYFNVDPMFGDLEIFKSLCLEAKKLNINIILDGVFSHTGSDSIYFNKKGRYDSTGAYQSKDSPYYNWYIWYDWPKDYHMWWGIDTLPTIDKKSSCYIDYIAGENGVVKYWQDMGAKGWRLDVADELPNHFLSELCKSMKNKDPEAYIVGEVWEDASNKFAYGKLKEYFLGNQLDSVTNYPLRTAIIEYVKNKNCDELYKTMSFIMEKYPPQTVNCLMNILGTHDTERILTMLSTYDYPKDKVEMSKYTLTSTQKSNGIKNLKIAALLQMTLPGVPCIYYGDEVGMEGWKDPFNRVCYPWGYENEEILSHYKFLTSLRKSHRVFIDGKYRCLVHDKEVFVFERFNESSKVIVAINLTQEDVLLNIKEKLVAYVTKEVVEEATISKESYNIFISTFNDIK